MVRIVWMLCVCVMVGGCHMKFPGRSFKGALPAQTNDETELATRLREHVETLAGAIGERNVHHRAQLRLAAEYIEQTFRTYGHQPVPLPYTVDGQAVRNIEVTIPGTTKASEIVVIGAHYDSVHGCVGANDNASGVAAVLATARLLRDTCRRRGVIVAFFDQEEIGLIGSTYLAEAYFQDGEDLIAAHTVDQVGWDQDGDRIYEIELPTAALYTQYSQAAAALGLGVPRQTATSGTDHSAFRAQGFAAAGVTEEYTGGDTTPHYHEAGDTAATVNLGYTRDAVRLVSRVVAAAAQ